MRLFVRAVFMSTISNFIGTQRGVSVLDELSTDGITLMNFLVLIVDIKYRKRYGHGLEWNSGKGYTNNMQNLPDQLTSVDVGLEDVRQRRLTDAVR